MTFSTRREHRLPALAAAFATLLLAACGGGGDEQAPDVGPLPPGTQPLAAAARLPAPRVTAQCYSPPVRTVFHSALEWNAYWTGTNQLCAPPSIPGSVDFSKEMLVFAAVGKRMSPRDSISIAGSGVRNDSLIIVVRRALLEPGCPGPKQAAFPMALVKLPATNAPVRFSEAHVRIPCAPS